MLVIAFTTADMRTEGLCAACATDNQSNSHIARSLVAHMLAVVKHYQACPPLQCVYEHPAKLRPRGRALCALGQKTGVVVISILNFLYQLIICIRRPFLSWKVQIWPIANFYRVFFNHLQESECNITRSNQSHHTPSLSRSDVLIKTRPHDRFS